MQFFRNSSSIALCSLLIVFASSGCAKENPPAVGYGSWSSPVYPLEERQSELVRSLDEAWLICQGACPEGADKVGMIGLATGPLDNLGRRPIGQCSGFLIGKNIVATNAHCLPPDAMRVTDCSATIAIKFLEPDSKGRRTYACKKVLARSDVETKPDGPDYGFFEIDASERAPLRIARDGVSDQTWLRSLRVDPITPGKPGGSISTADCHAAQNSLLNINFTNEYSPTALAVGCEARQGNSGSPVLNLNNEVVGILQSKKLDVYMDLLRKPLRQLGVEFPQNPPNHFVFTNLSCIKDPETGRNLNEPNCSAVREDNMLASLGQRSFVKQAEAKGGARADAWQKRLPTFATWKFLPSKESGLLTAHVRCLRPLADWPEAMLATQEREGMLWRKKRFQYHYESALALRPRLQLDDQLRFRNDAEVNETTIPWRVELSFTREGGEVEGFTEATDSRFAVRVPLITNWCSAEELAQGDDVSAIVNAEK